MELTNERLERTADAPQCRDALLVQLPQKLVVALATPIAIHTSIVAGDAGLQARPARTDIQDSGTYEQHQMPRLRRDQLCQQRNLSAMRRGVAAHRDGLRSPPVGLRC